MKHQWLLPSCLVVLYLSVPSSAADTVITEKGTATSVQEEPENRSSATDSPEDIPAPVALPLCTLSVTTVPESVLVNLDGRLFGKTPLVIENIDTGSHVIVLQKIGFYQKKAALKLSAPGITAVSFELNAPGRLQISSTPPGATVLIDGRKCGITPYVDSLVKPGNLRITLEKENYLSVEKPLTVSGGTTSELSETLSPAPAGDGTDAQMEIPAAADQRPKKRFLTAGIVAGVFSLFMLVLAVIELRE